MKNNRHARKLASILIIGYIIFSAVILIYATITKFIYEETMVDTDQNGEVYYIGTAPVLQTIIEPPKTSMGIGILLSKSIDAGRGNVYIKLLDNTNNMKEVASTILSSDELVTEPKYYYIYNEERFLNNLNEYTLSIECDDAIANNICCYLIDNSSCRYTYGYTIENNNLMMNMIFIMKMHPAIIYIWIIISVFCAILLSMKLRVFIRYFTQIR